MTALFPKFQLEFFITVPQLRWFYINLTKAISIVFL